MLAADRPSETTMTQPAAFTVHQGATLKFDVDYTGADGTPVEGLDTATAELRFSPGAEMAPVAATIAPETGTLSFAVPATETEYWPAGGSGIGFQVWLTYQDGTTEMILDGTISVNASY